jgi:hypothetical protein
MRACSINPRSRCGALASLLAALIAVTIAVAGLSITSSPASAAVTLEDVNPNNSDLDPNDPDGATGGRVNGVASVPGDNQTYYAASEWGGLYKSTDAGVTWLRLDRHLPVATWRVKVDPSNTRIVYATSFYDGRITPLSGIQVSRDAGATWTHPLTSHPGPAFNCVVNARRTEPSAFGIGIRPDATNNVFIGTNCGVAISNDSGDIWRFVNPTPLTAAGTVWDVVVQAGGANGIVDICGDNGHLRSIDGGNTWTPGGGALPAGRCSIAVSPDESYVLFVAAADNNLYESNDAGATWRRLGNPTPQGRIPFVVTNDRAGTAFDLWFGDVSLFRTGCTTPDNPAPGGADRCPLSTAWAGPFTRSRGAHDDAGFLVFDSQVAVDACPRIFSSDGGIYRNTTVVSPACHTPTWEQPTRTPHGLWLFTMSGAPSATAAASDLYFGTQDNGSFGTLTGGAALPTWHNQDCCDVFDSVADASRVVYTVCCFGGRANRMFVRAPGLGAGAEIPNYPPGNLIAFTFPDGIVRFGDGMYAVVTTSGVFFTLDITAGPIVWTQFGAATSPAGPCAIWSSVDVPSGTPVFYVMTGGCNPRFSNQVWTFFGTGAGSWTRIDNNNGLTGGFGIFAVDPSNANRLYASHLPPTGPEMVFSNDAGLNWQNNPELDHFMNGGGFFRATTTVGPTEFTGFGGYPQPSLVAFDPVDPKLVVAGGIDSGVFLSTNGGLNWFLITDPFDSGNSGVPHLPRPRYAYFDHETTGTTKLYIGTQGRGVWRITLVDLLQVLNAELSGTRDPATFAFDPTPVKDGPAGTFSFTAAFCNIGAKQLILLKSVTTTLTGGNVLLNRDVGTPPGVGSAHSFPATQGFADGVLSGGECVDVLYQIGLATNTSFEFLVNAVGIAR